MESHSGASAWEAVVDVLREAPGLGLGIVTVEGRLLYHNAEAARLHFGDASVNVSGRLLTQIYPERWVAERLRIYQRATATGRGLLVRSLHRGVRLETYLRPIPPGYGEPSRLLAVIRPGVTPAGAVPPGIEVLEAESVSLGPLRVLTPRELEVLALIGRGMSTRDIGDALGCSPRTIERHRDALGKKLQRRDRVELALIAHQAGLEVRDARRPRVEPLVGRAAAELMEVKPSASEPSQRPG